VSGSTLSGNSATADVTRRFPVGGFGGGIYSFSFWGAVAAVTVSDSTLSGNSATQGGGAIYQGTFATASVPLTASTLPGNPAGAGAAISNDLGATLAVRGCTFSGNTAGDSGGAIYNSGTATLKDSTLSGNTAGANGGGIFNDAAGILVV